MRQASLALLVGGFGRQVIADQGLAREFGVYANQLELFVFARMLNDLRHLVFELCQRKEGPRVQRFVGNPQRMLVQAVKQLQGVTSRGAVEGFKRQCHWV